VKDGSRARNGRSILPATPTSMYNRRVLSHAANVRHGTDGFTSPPKEGGFALKNPTASPGFEPVNLGTKGQHATSRPPTPLRQVYNFKSPGYGVSAQALTPYPGDKNHC
jgi:hypothetical protein